MERKVIPYTEMVGITCLQEGLFQKSVIRTEGIKSRICRNAIHRYFYCLSDAFYIQT